MGKVRVCGSNLLLLREMLGVGASVLIVQFCAEDEFYCETVSQLFLPISVWV